MFQSLLKRKFKKKDETVNAVEFIYELLKGGDKDFFTKQEIFESLKRAMDIEQSKQSVKQKVK